MLYIVLIALATKQALDIWFYSSLMSGSRARVELWEGKLGELLSCRFCLSVWVALVCFLALMDGDCMINLGFDVLGGLAQAPVYALACAKAAGWLHDWAKSWEDVPKHNELPIETTKLGEPHGEADEAKT